MTRAVLIACARVPANGYVYAVRTPEGWKCLYCGELVKVVA